jgi:hypothetical protein
VTEMNQKQLSNCTVRYVRKIELRVASNVL